MNPAKHPDRERVAQHGAEPPVRSVLLVPEPVAVLDQRLPSAERCRARPDVIRHADVAREELAAPAVVVSGDPEHFDAGLAQRRERREHAKADPRHHVAPLEPEIEHVAVQHDRLRLGPGPLQQRQQRALGLCRSGAEVHIRQDDAGGVGHSREPISRRDPLQSRRCGITCSRANHDHRSPRPVRGNRPDAGRVSLELPRVVRGGPHRLHAPARNELRGNGKGRHRTHRLGVQRPPSRERALRRRGARSRHARRRAVAAGDVRISADERPTGERLATARTSLVSIAPAGRPVAMPPGSARALEAFRG